MKEKGGTYMINNKNKDRNNDKTIGNQMRNSRTHDNGRMGDEAWIKEVRRLMAGREVTAPDDLLASVRREVDSCAQANPVPAPVPPVSSAKARVVPLRNYRWAAAVAVVVAFALPVTLHMLQKKGAEVASSDLPGAMPSALGRTDVSPRASIQHAASAPEATSIASSPSQYLAFNGSAAEGTPASANQASPVDQASSGAQATSDVQASSEAPSLQPSHTSPDTQQPPATKHSRSGDYAAYDTPIPSTYQSTVSHNFSVTAYCGGIGSGSGQGSGMTQGILLADAAPYGFASIEMREGAGRNGMVAVDRKKMKAHHAQPVKVGISVGYSLTNRWSVNTGLTYSYLSSDFTADGEPKQTQRLHYVGIPLSGSYSLLKSRKAEIYVTAGGEVEKLVKGTVSSKNGLSGNRDEKVRESRPQFSAKAALGGAYHFTPSLSVYAEPGVSYYFNNHSAVINVYKDRPTSFSLNVGVRYTVK